MLGLGLEPRFICMKARYYYIDIIAQSSRRRSMTREQEQLAAVRSSQRSLICYCQLYLFGLCK